MIRFSAIVFSLLCVDAARANDTMATIEGGNVVFAKSAIIAMKSERLVISPTEIDVEYEFENQSAQPIEATVAFPLGTMSSETPYAFDVTKWSKENDPLGFVVEENGVRKPAELKLERKNYPDGVFALTASYVWKQVFPAHKTIRLRHHYKTNAGSGGLTPEGKKYYCADKPFLTALEALKVRLAKSGHLDQTAADPVGAYMHFHSFSHVAYVLKTANNWAGPIGHFELVIRKDAPSTLLSVCWDGLQKASPTELRFTKDAFVPLSDLRILFVHER